MVDRAALYRKIPKVDVLRERLEAEGAFTGVAQALLTDVVRRVVDAYREALAGRGPAAADADPGRFFDGAGFRAAVAAELARRLARRHVPVINATGILLHTGLGRAPLGDDAIDAVQEAARYSVVEVDLESGERNLREGRVAELLVELTGAEAATVVNNNAGAVLLALAALAHGKEVLVARGELVEIGGGFRMPDVMAASGATLVEVGTTNRTYVADFARAAGAQSGMILKVHTSNFRISGFTHAPAEEELVELAERTGLPYVHDLGSGLLFDCDLAPLADEPSVVRSLRAGAGLVTFSGDKLLCGPQAGLIAGKAPLVRALRAHPLYRALRPDKLQLAALEATLLAFARQPGRLPDLPLFRALRRPLDDLRGAAEHLVQALRRQEGVTAEARATTGFLGSGSAPAREIPGVGVALRSRRHTAEALARRLRTGEPAVLPRIEADWLILDLRSLLDGELEPLLEATLAALAGTGAHAGAPGRAGKDPS